MQHHILESFEQQCTQDAPPACQCRCPIHVEAGSVASLVASGHVDEARKVLERHLPLAALTGRLCEGPCQEKCLRQDLGGSINLPVLETYVVTCGRPVKSFPLPGTSHRAALVGGGLSSLVTASELAKKGHKAVVYHLGPLGGYLRELSPQRLPPLVLQEAIESLRRLKAQFIEASSLTELAELLETFEAKDFKTLFIGLDDPALDPKALGLSVVDLESDPVTMGISRPNVFVVTQQRNNPHASAICGGKKASGSMARLFQNVSPGTAREKEAISETKLVVSLTGVEPAPQMHLADPLSPTPQEAAAEAGRCLSCSCLSCLPPCPFLRQRPGIYPKKLAREFYNNIITAFGNRSSNRFINSCAQCGLCGQLCPNGADLGQFVDLCRLDMVSTNHMPVSAHEYPLEDQVFSNSPAAAFLRHQPGTSESTYLLFPGCQLTASLPETTTDLYRYLSSHLAGGVGLWTGCCGAPGRWSGRLGLTGRTTEAMAKAWQQAGSPKVILACPSCRLTFSRQLPFVATIGLWEVLSGLELPPTAAPLPGPALLHDPCAARLDEAGQDGVRAVLTALGQEFFEPALTRRLTMCCGYGGLVDQAFPQMGELFVSERVKDAQHPFIAWCVMCRDRFNAFGHPALHPLELLFSPPEAMILTPEMPPGISKRRDNRLNFRHQMLSEFWHETVSEDPSMNLNIDIPGSVLEQFEEQRILVSDVTKVLEHAAQNGPTFVNQQTGHSLACLRPRQVTFWVDYEVRTDGTYLVHRAWCHRMTLPNVNGEGQESPASLEGFAKTGGRV
ncbi:MAG: 4Fe-4S dicluster domain-containing protein [Deltaproteobacteria bacterium]|nr:4Fe-4S dicluster domain-containing protein [Deltaproteobacteria bacterium]